MDMLKMADSAEGVVGEEFARQMKAAERIMRENRTVLRQLAKDEPEPDSEEPVAEPSG